MDVRSTNWISLLPGNCGPPQVAGRPSPETTAALEHLAQRGFFAGKNLGPTVLAPVAAGEIGSSLRTAARAGKGLLLVFPRGMRSILARVRAMALVSPPSAGTWTAIVRVPNGAAGRLPLGNHEQTGLDLLTLIAPTLLAPGRVGRAVRRWSLATLGRLDPSITVTLYLPGDHDTAPPVAAQLAAAAGLAGTIPISYAANRLREYLFLVTPEQQRPLALLKIGYDPGQPRGSVLPEYRVLERLTPLGTDRIGFATPTALGATLTQACQWCLQSGLCGQPAEHVFRAGLAEDRRDAIVRLLLDLIARRHRLEDALRALSADLPTVDPGYFYDESAVAPPPLNTIQHGDFALTNLLVASPDHGLFDWEWCGKGYPPHFDLFTLLMSVGYTGGRPAQFTRAALQASFFETNWFSDLAAKVLTERGVSREQAFRCLLAFLSFYVNKFRIFFDDPSRRDAFAAMRRQAYLDEPRFLPQLR